MSGVTMADVSLLDLATEEQLRALPPLLAAAEGYRAALRALRAAPSDLAVDVPDRSADVDDVGERLASLAQVPAAFAFALRQLDHRGEDGFAGPGCDPRQAGEEAADRLARLRVAHPNDPPAVLLDRWRSPGTPPELPTTPAATGPHWLAEVVEEVDRSASVAEDLARHTGDATLLRHVAPVAKVAGWAAFPVPAYQQLVADRGDHNLTEGDRVVGMVAATAEGSVAGAAGTLGAAAGAKKGALLGAALGPKGALIGAGVGALAGTVVGAIGGGKLRRTAPVRAVEDRAARAYDRVRGTGHQDRHERDHGVRSGR
jgi:surface antigen